MKRFGSNHQQMHSMDENEVFLLRLNLLIVIVKASLKGYPIGEFRKKAALETAKILYKLILDFDLSFLNLQTPPHLFKERIKLLSIMATAITSESYPLGIHRRNAVLDNIKVISEYAFPGKTLKLFHEVLKVA